MKNFAERLKSLRLLSGMGSKEYATLLGISSGSLSNYENGSSTPTGKKLAQISEQTGKSIEWLLNGADNSDSEIAEVAPQATERTSAPLPPGEAATTAAPDELSTLRLAAAQAEIRALQAEFRAAKAEWELEKASLQMELAKRVMEKAELEARQPENLKSKA